jgi:hypothetical protein
MALTARQNILHEAIPMPEEITFESLRAMALRAGLRLADDELQRLLPGVNRSKKQAVELRESLTTDDEPAVSFAASKARQK